MSSNLDIQKFFVYLDTYSLNNPYKIAKYKGFVQYRFFIERKDHKDPKKKLELLKYIDWFQSI